MRENDQMNLFTAEIELFDDPDEGLRFQAPENLVSNLTRALTDAGLTVTGSRVATPGTVNIPSNIEVSVNGTFDTMNTVIRDMLISDGVKLTEENFSSMGEKHIRFNLDNVSVFGR